MSHIGTFTADAETASLKKFFIPVDRQPTWYQVGKSKSDSGDIVPKGAVLVSQSPLENLLLLLDEDRASLVDHGVLSSPSIQNAVNTKIALRFAEQPELLSVINKDVVDAELIYRAESLDHREFNRLVKEYGAGASEFLGDLGYLRTFGHNRFRYPNLSRQFKLTTRALDKIGIQAENGETKEAKISIIRGILNDYMPSASISDLARHCGVHYGDPQEKNRKDLDKKYFIDAKSLLMRHWCEAAKLQNGKILDGFSILNETEKLTYIRQEYVEHKIPAQRIG